MPLPRVSGITGEPVSVVLTVAQNCPSEIAMTATVAVLGPDNQPIAVEGATRSIQPDSNGVRTTVIFTPAAAGPYHLTARFEPNLGLAQEDVVVASDRRQERPVFALTGDLRILTCTNFDVTPAQKIVCLRPSFVAFAPDGGALQTIGSQWAAHVDGVVWALEGSRLSRWVERGSAFVREPDGELLLPNTNLAFAPSTTELAGVSLSGELSRIEIVDAGLALSQAASFGGPIPGGGTGGGGPQERPFGTGFGVLWRDQDELLAAGGGGFCELTLDAGRGPCAEFRGEPIAVDVDGLWTTRGLGGDNQPFMLELRRNGFQTEVFVKALIVFPRESSHWNKAPRAQDETLVYLPVFDGQQLSLSAWNSSPPMIDATHNWVIRRDHDTILFFRR